MYDIDEELACAQDLFNTLLGAEHFCRIICLMLLVGLLTTIFSEDRWLRIEHTGRLYPLHIERIII